MRRLFVHGGRAVLAQVKRERHQFGGWLDRLEARSKKCRHRCNGHKIARMAWAVLTSGHRTTLLSARKEKLENQKSDFPLSLTTAMTIYEILTRFASRLLMAEQVKPTRSDPAGLYGLQPRPLG